MSTSRDLILAVPLDLLDKLATPDIAIWAPQLADVRYLRTEPMISMDLFFRKKLCGLPNGITLLLDSPYEMSFFDNSQTWKDLPSDSTVLNVVASNADTLAPYGDEHIMKALLKSSHYIEYDRDDCSNAARICRPILASNCSSIRSGAGNGVRNRLAEFRTCLSLETTARPSSTS